MSCGRSSSSEHSIGHCRTWCIHDENRCSNECHCSCNRSDDSLLGSIHDDSLLGSIHDAPLLGSIHDDSSLGSIHDDDRDIDEEYEKFKAHNEGKNIFKAARTPAVFFAIAVVFYIVSGVCGLLGLYSIANTCNLCMGVALLTLITWAYIRYSGEMTDIGLKIDDVANTVWDKVMKPGYKAVIEKGVEQAVLSRSNSYIGKASGGPTSGVSYSRQTSHNGRPHQS